MSSLVLVVFALTYVGLAVGKIPGLAVDRTGIAVLGGIVLLVLGSLSLEQAVGAIDAPTLIVLLGMMLLSAQFQASGFYAVVVQRLSAVQRPRRLLGLTIGVTAVSSALLTNDVVCFALTPLLTQALLRAGLPPLPYLLGLACASNIGSALTPIGNPQNILIAQRLQLAFLPFVVACAVPVLLSLVLLYVFLRTQVPKEHRAPAAPVAAPAVDRLGAAKAVVLTTAAVALFLSPVPAYVTGLGVTGAVLLSRRLPTRELLARVDWQLLSLFVGLFTVVRGLEVAGWSEAAREALARGGMNVSHPAFLVPAIAALSNVISNVPAVMLTLPFVDRAPDTGYVLALASTFAGNAVIVGSIANLIVVEQAQRLGVRISFWQHARVGLPVTLASLGLAVLTGMVW